MHTPKKDEKMKNSFFVLLLTFLVLASASAHAWTGHVVAVTDGDTIKVLQDGRETKIRLYGVDTPEKKQAFGQKAKVFTASLVAGKMVDVEPVDQDRYGRTVGLVTVAGRSLNEELVKNGFAWVYRQYCRRGECSKWIEEESQVRATRIGLWVDPAPMPPWKWRRMKK
ncbi:MAG: thermonuclease family protein [Desulfurivibrionaceae bacterium]|jgi:endonuclease YncB( thermonuclease family)